MDKASEADLNKQDANLRLRTLHMFSAVFVGSYLLLHLTNHAAMLWGQAQHIQIMESLRNIYRIPIIEYPLIAFFMFQILSGLKMIWKTFKKRSGFVAWVQAISGIIVALFLINHISAVFVGRLVLGLDTNYWFAAAGFHAGFAWFFMPYYFSGVAAVFVHISCALWWRLPIKLATPLAICVSAFGVIFALGLVNVMASDTDIPPSYLKTYN